MQQKQKKRFVLTMRNQNGQVGIFVALIFQVVFVFFAMLVNVGLVVHHKINLQQSTDLAAYYGAMKQAEIMNVIAHVNFQMRQAWKLMSWRYRVLGTFGMEQDPGKPVADQIQFPISWPQLPDSTRRPRYNPNSKNFVCNNPGAAGLTITDVPFMCMGHDGFGDWISQNNNLPAAQASGQLNETFCKFTCETIANMTAFSVSDIPTVSTQTIHGNTLGSTIATAIGVANQNVENVCKKLSPMTVQMLALFYGNYIKDTQNRKEFIKMMAKNLGLSEKEMLDIEGNKVFTGVENTLKNNLTEANLTALSEIVPLNGVKAFNGNSFADGMLREITFKRLLFFVVDCVYGGGAKTTELKELYNGVGGLNSHVKARLADLVGAGSADNIEKMFLMNSERFNILGFEKNPYIQVYYGVKASSSPRIPFLPLAKVKLTAVSFAKPFGGTIGPWYFKTWQPNDPDNDGRTDWENRTDNNLPKRNSNGIASPPTLKDAREFLFNYSTHVGDVHSNDATPEVPANKAGLANTNVVALYHNMLANKMIRSPATVPADTAVSGGKSLEPRAGYFAKPLVWPMYSLWFHLAEDVTSPKFDPLAVDRLNPTAPKNSYMRDIELTVVAPNQFDVTYYSIEPDFQNNYVFKIQPNIAKFAAATGTGVPPVMPVDFGSPSSPVDGVKTFSVRHQIQVVHDLFKSTAADIIGINGNTDSTMRFGLDVLATKQASLLTGWTFLDLMSDSVDTGYKNFPSPTKGGPFSMLFGTCDSDSKLNPWSDSYQAPYESGDPKLPPVPGNCVTGGRTGYSVKIISSDLLRDDPSRTFENIGGPSTTGRILNPIPEDFLRF